jgi:hypothetical protein
MSTPEYHYTVNTTDYDTASVRSKTVLEKYTILNDMADSETHGAYRSVVLWKETNRPVAFAPVRAISFDAFMEKYRLDSDEVQTTDIIEGTMVNLFYTPEGWEIATKSAIGGNYWYYRTHYNVDDYKQKTFRQMFLDAMRVDADTPLDDVPFIRALSKEYSYCFVVQHPENHIVLQVDEPRVWLVAMFRITAVSEDSSEYRIRNITQSEFKTLIPEFDAIGVVRLPEIQTYDQSPTADFLRNSCSFWSPTYVGIMITKHKNKPAPCWRSNTPSGSPMSRLVANLPYNDSYLAN